MAAKHFRTLTTAFACALGAMTLSGGILHAGGWAVITFQNVPLYLTAGVPATIGYTIRQHGHTPINGLAGRIEARQGSIVVSAKTNKLPLDGAYAATITMPVTGRWTIGVTAGSGLAGDATAMPVDVIGRHDQPPAMSESDRGRVLFEGKGCVMCHAHDAFGGKRGLTSFVDLSARHYAPEQVTAFLTSLRTQSPALTSDRTMPDLGLVDHEIHALAAFLGR